ncbi:hypothetical protein EMIT0P176_320004 [Pseudomonas sp. IT-P176]
MFSKPFFSDSLARETREGSKYTVGFGLHIVGIDRHKIGSKNGELICATWTPKTAKSWKSCRKKHASP